MNVDDLTPRSERHTKRNILQNAHDGLECLSPIKMIFGETNHDNDNTALCSIDNANAIEAHNLNCKNCVNWQKEIEDLKQEWVNTKMR